MTRLTSRLYSLLRWSEKYTKTDMVYLVSSGFWLNLNVAITTVLSFLLSIAFANLLVPEVYGTYQYLLSFATIAGALTLTGMNYAVTTAVARGHEGVFRESVRIQSLWAIVPIFFSLLTGAYYFYQGNVTLGFGLLAIGLLVPIINIFNTYSAFLNGKKEFRRAFIYSSFLNICYFVSIFLGVLYLKDALLLFIINLGINALIIFFLYIRTLTHYKPNNASDSQALTYGKHLSTMNAFTIAVRQTDSILVFHFFGPVQLAIYTFASTIPEKVAGLFKFLFFAALPKFSTQEKSSIQSNILSKMWKVTGASVVVAIVYFFSAPYIFQFLFPKYLVALPYSQLYALIIITSSGNLSLSALIAKRETKALYIFNSISAITLLLLQVILLILYGIWGILIARILSNLFDTILSTALILQPEKETNIRY